MNRFWFAISEEAVLKNKKVRSAFVVTGELMFQKKFNKKVKKWNYFFQVHIWVVIIQNYVITVVMNKFWFTFSKKVDCAFVVTSELMFQKTNLINSKKYVIILFF